MKYEGRYIHGVAINNFAFLVWAGILPAFFVVWSATGWLRHLRLLTTPLFVGWCCCADGRMNDENHQREMMSYEV
jgi:hypothetical protein